MSENILKNICHVYFKIGNVYMYIANTRQTQENVVVINKTGCVLVIMTKNVSTDHEFCRSSR